MKPYDWADEQDDPGFPADADEYAEQESENHQGHELDVWPYVDRGYLTELTEIMEDR